MADWVWKQGDNTPAIAYKLQYADGSPVSLVDAQVTLRMRSMATASLVALTGTVEILSMDGDVAYAPTSEDSSNAVGNYIAEWVVNDGGLVTTFPQDGYLWGQIEPNAATAPQLIVSLADMRQYLKGQINTMDKTYDTDLLEAIQVVTPIVESIVGPVVTRTFDEWHDGGSAVIDLLRQPSSGFGSNPVMTLLAVSEYRGPIEYPLSLVPSPVFGSIYSVFLNADMGTITRRTAGGSTIPFMPGTEVVHVIYQVGQNPVPPNIQYAAKEAAAMVYTWHQQTGDGSRRLSDDGGAGENAYQLTRLIRNLLMPSRRAPSTA
jgi:hypothetical protein